MGRTTSRLNSIHQVFVKMKPTAPHYLLFTEAKNIAESSTVGGRWRFVLEQIGTAIRIEEADFEPDVKGERLQLLAVVRGLEALEQRSHVTLITSSKYVGRGIRRGLTQWRQNDWQWERYGRMALIKNHDLWQRIDLAMQIHFINCRVWQFDPPHVRTQVANEADQAELTGIRHRASEFDVDPARDPSEVANRDRLIHPPALPPMKKKIELARRERRNQSGNAPRVRESVGRGNNLTLNLGTRSESGNRSTFVNTLNQVSRVTNALADRVKPMGKGKAFGYAMS